MSEQPIVDSSPSGALLTGERHVLDVEDRGHGMTPELIAQR
jgi:hypothetical protein